MNKKQPFIISLSQELRQEIKGGLLKYDKIKIVGLGVFENKIVPARFGRNPSTGKIVKFPKFIRIKFKPTKSLKEAVQ